MVEVLWPKENGPKPLQTLCEQAEGIEDETARMEIDQLERKHLGLWQLFVFVDPVCSMKQRKSVAAHCGASKHFHTIRNHLPEFEPSAEEALFNEKILTAIATLPPGQAANNAAVTELLQANFHKGKANLSVAEIQRLLTSNPETPADRQMTFAEPVAVSPRNAPDKSDE